MEQNTETWLEWRKQGIGGSDLAAILNISPHSNATPRNVWRIKKGIAPDVTSFIFEKGHETEKKARSRYELISMEDMNPGTAVHPKYEVCRVSLDGISEDRKKLLEIKLLDVEAIEKAKQGIIPEYYVPQTQYQLAVTGADVLHFFGYHEATDSFALVEVFPDLKYQGELIAQVLHWWDKHIIGNVEPDLTPKDVLEVEDNQALINLCTLIYNERETLTKNELKPLLAEVIEIGGHTKIKCGKVRVSTVLRNGKFSYHKLTVEKENAANV